jgi:hypothetical protein
MLRPEGAGSRRELSHSELPARRAGSILPFVIRLDSAAIPCSPDNEAPGCGWFVAGFTAGHELSMECSAASPFALADPKIDVFVVLDPETREALGEALPSVLEEFSPGQSALIFLLPWQTPPETHMRDDGPVYSFACSASLLRSLAEERDNSSIARLSFEILSAVADGVVHVDKLLVRHFPRPEAPRPSPAEPPSTAVIMAHRGKPTHLAAALRYLQKAAGGEMNIRVGLDVDEPRGYEDLILVHPAIEFYCTRPAALGPYVIRDELTGRSCEPLFLFHDSDDLSCSDRFPVLYTAMIATGCDLIGSHELKLDEMCCEVRAFRFPLDVSGALLREIAHPLQHPTSMIKRDAFRRAGGFSTDRRISNDTQFLLRAHFSMRIRNADAFVYVRRKHEAALTEAPDTGMHMPIRRWLKQTWSADFRAVKNGELQLNDSSLRRVAGVIDYEFERLPRSSGRP